MSNSFLKPIAVALMLAVAPLSISNVQAAAVKVGSYVGIWSAKNSYGAGDLITLNNKTFLSLVARNLNKNPDTNPTSWQLLGGVGAGSIGLTGSQGIQGPKGDTGLQGLTGTAGTNGAAGAQGLLGAQGIQGIQGVKGDTGLTGTGGLKVFDANHNVIGDFHEAFSRVFMDINGKTYALAVASDGFGRNINNDLNNDLFYSANDCTGTAYYSVSTNHTTDFGLKNHLWVANKIYEIDPTKLISITANSTLHMNYCNNANSMFNPRTIQAETLQDLTLIQDLSIYPTPFTIGKE